MHMVIWRHITFLGYFYLFIENTQKNTSFSFLQINTFQLHDKFSAEADVLIDPNGLAKPGHVHVAHVIVTLTYSGYHDNCTNPNTGDKLEKVTEDAYTSFFFYVLGLWKKKKKKKQENKLFNH